MTVQTLAESPRWRATARSNFRAVAAEVAASFSRSLNASLSSDRLQLLGWDERTREGFISTDQETSRIGLSSGFELAVTHRLRVGIDGGRPKPSTTEYYYQIFHRGQPIVEFHYHPDEPKAPDCHLHIKVPAPGWPRLSKMHIPTGRVAFEDVLLLLIGDFRLKARPNARRVIEGERRKYEADRTWIDRRSASK